MLRYSTTGETADPVTLSSELSPLSSTDVRVTQRGRTNSEGNSRSETVTTDGDNKTVEKVKGDGHSFGKSKSTSDGTVTTGGGSTDSVFDVTTRGEGNSRNTTDIEVRVTTPEYTERFGGTFTVKTDGEQTFDGTVESGGATAGSSSSAHVSGDITNDSDVDDITDTEYRRDNLPSSDDLDGGNVPGSGDTVSWSESNNKTHDKYGNSIAGRVENITTPGGIVARFTGTVTVTVGKEAEDFEDTDHNRQNIPDGYIETEKTVGRKTTPFKLKTTAQVTTDGQGETTVEVPDVNLPTQTVTNWVENKYERRVDHDTQWGVDYEREDRHTKHETKITTREDFYEERNTFEKTVDIETKGSYFTSQHPAGYSVKNISDYDQNDSTTYTLEGNQETLEINNHTVDKKIAEYEDRLIDMKWRSGEHGRVFETTWFFIDDYTETWSTESKVDYKSSHTLLANGWVAMGTLTANSEDTNSYSIVGDYEISEFDDPDPLDFQLDSYNTHVDYRTEDKTQVEENGYYFDLLGLRLNFGTFTETTTSEEKTKDTRQERYFEQFTTPIEGESVKHRDDHNIFDLSLTKNTTKVKQGIYTPLGSIEWLTTNTADEDVTYWHTSDAEHYKINPTDSPQKSDSRTEYDYDIHQPTNGVLNGSITYWWEYKRVRKETGEVLNDDAEYIWNDQNLSDGFHYPNGEPSGTGGPPAPQETDTSESEGGGSTGEVLRYNSSSGPLSVLLALGRLASGAGGVIAAATFGAEAATEKANEAEVTNEIKRELAPKYVYTPREFKNASPKVKGPFRAGLDKYGLPTGLDEWSPRRFFRDSNIRHDQASYYGCGGLLGMRAGLTTKENRGNPALLHSLKDAKAFGSALDALNYIKKDLKGNGLLTLAESSDGPFEVALDRSERFAIPLMWNKDAITVRVEIGKSYPAFDVNTVGAQNYRTLLGTPKEWYWEYADGRGGDVKHNQSTLRKHRVFIVIPNAPFKSPISPGFIEYCKENSY